ncbi:MAG TPA: hypothetical protein VEA40_22670 [Ramlibacter sp.]|nr:hypothetical protein [Ramlibacter sp.]
MRGQAGVWTPEMDDQLIERRVTKGLPWRAVAPIGPMNKRRCQARMKLLEKGRPEVRQAAPTSPPEPEDRDGLDWLVAKKRVSHAQGLKGYDYRALFRHVIDMGGAPLGSSLENLMSTGGQATFGGLPSAGSYTASAARAELFRMRWVVLRGQTDLLTVMDGVCGLGHTVRTLAGPGSQQQVRAAQLEAALKIALDLLIADEADRAAKKTA